MSALWCRNFASCGNVIRRRDRCESFGARGEKRCYAGQPISIPRAKCLLGQESFTKRIWQPGNNVPPQSGTSRKRLKLRDEREQLRICQNRRAPLSAKKELRLHERNEVAQDKVPAKV